MPGASFDTPFNAVTALETPKPTKIIGPLGSLLFGYDSSSRFPECPNIIEIYTNWKGKLLSIHEFKIAPEDENKAKSLAAIIRRISLSNTFNKYELKLLIPFLSENESKVTQAFEKKESFGGECLARGTTLSITERWGFESLNNILKGIGTYRVSLFETCKSRGTMHILHLELVAEIPNSDSIPTFGFYFIQDDEKPLYCKCTSIQGNTISTFQELMSGFQSVREFAFKHGVTRARSLFRLLEIPAPSPSQYESNYESSEFDQDFGSNLYSDNPSKEKLNSHSKLGVKPIPECPPYNLVSGLEVAIGYYEARGMGRSVVVRIDLLDSAGKDSPSTSVDIIFSERKGTVEKLITWYKTLINSFEIKDGEPYNPNYSALINQLESIGQFKIKIRQGSSLPSLAEEAFGKIPYKISWNQGPSWNAALFRAQFLEGLLRGSVPYQFSRNSLSPRVFSHLTWHLNDLDGKVSLSDSLGGVITYPLKPAVLAEPFLEYRAEQIKAVTEAFLNESVTFNSVGNFWGYIDPLILKESTVINIPFPFDPQGNRMYEHVEAIFDIVSRLSSHDAVHLAPVTQQDFTVRRILQLNSYAVGVKPNIHNSKNPQLVLWISETGTRALQIISESEPELFWSLRRPLSKSENEDLLKAYWDEQTVEHVDGKSLLRSIVASIGKDALGDQYRLRYNPFKT